ncbi:abasic site processing protein HMCES [Rhinatrema bivittatum]|uniref:abasic site processing protein HMCES n=1 Tax=Rhinatrema bivittatum TaxID=194408 RepID=UPI001127B5BB|nr:abasic site processing protein HMCES [Rhinatrema bivittatum]XP_029435755.1 abasic site processing protein HMCES [Rhinatrema bivittatum]XP_029435763.1 abasic site processing protein HMCES [Rhinatrema bivittatum]XP_029435768.1 abasic site processing protein HMCES [Rhinatrema bivittatum]
MCGRTACTLAPDNISKACTYWDGQGRRRRPEWRDGDSDKYKPSYNKSPQSNSPVLLSLKHFQKDANTSERVIASMRWGLIPPWFSERDPSKMQYNTTNCRSDTIMEKALYKAPLVKGKRCVILADGFYEWQRQNGEKQPYYIYFPQSKEEKISEKVNGNSEWNGWRLLTMAGLFECWEPPDGGDQLYSYTVITVNASKSINWLHDRMPAILDGDEAVQKWLDFGEVSTQEALKLIHPTECIAFHPVSTIVNNSRNNTPECIAPIELRVKKEPTLSASSRKMFDWLKSKSPKKEEPSPPGSLKQSSKANTPKKTSAGLMHKWLKKEEGESSPKKLKLN